MRRNCKGRRGRRAFWPSPSTGLRFPTCSKKTRRTSPATFPDSVPGSRRVFEGSDVNFHARSGMGLWLCEVMVGELRVKGICKGGRPAGMERLPVAHGSERRVEVVQQ